jgi:hypothetical protein
MPKMRAKLQVGMVQVHRERDGEIIQETLSMFAICRTNGYSDTGGLDEDNTFAKYSPGASLVINVANSELFGKFAVGDKFYVDFTSAD